MRRYFPIDSLISLTHPLRDNPHRCARFLKSTSRSSRNSLCLPTREKHCIPFSRQLWENFENSAVQKFLIARKILWKAKYSEDFLEEAAISERRTVSNNKRSADFFLFSSLFIPPPSQEIHFLVFAVSPERSTQMPSIGSNLRCGVMKGRSTGVTLFKWHALSVPVTNKVIDPIAIATKPR